MDFPGYAANAITQGVGSLAAPALGAMYAASKYNRSKKSRALVRQVYRNRGELKVKQFNSAILSVAANSLEYVELTNLTGGEDSDERIGRTIRGLGFKFRGTLSDRNLDCYVVLSRPGIAPSFASWNDVIGGLLKDEYHYEFKELADLKRYDSTTLHLAKSVKWRRPINTYYTGTVGSSGIRNKVYLVFVNTTADAISCQYSINYYYRDH